MPNDGIDPKRRQLIATLAGTGALGATAGCIGNFGGGSNASGGGNASGGSGSSDFQKAAKNIGFGQNWKQRRLTSLNEWPLEARQATPPENKQASIQAWKNSRSVKSAPWKPPEGWKETAAANVDSIQVLNFGNMKFDPGTLATNALFEKKTGIKIDPLEIVVDQAIPKETAFLKAGRGKPPAFSVVIPSSLASFVNGDYLTQLDPLMPKSEMWKPYQPVADSVQYNGHTYSGPLYLEGSLVHARPDLLKNQGIPDDSVTAILDGTWTWDDLETAMKAFKGTGTYAWAYRGGSRTYMMRDFLKMLYQAGGQLYNSQSGKVKVNTKAGYTALGKMVEWRKKGYVPNEVVSYGQGDLADGFLSGQFAMVPVYGDLVPRALKQYKKGEEYQPTLSPKGGKSASKPTRAGVASPNGVSINVNAPTDKKLATMLYLDACLSHSGQWWQFAVEGNQSFLKAPYSEAAKTGAVDFAKIRNKQISLNKAEVFPQSRPIRQTISQECQSAIAGDISPKKALDNAQDFINSVLGQ
jgi:multiple sugar transport system substrate-binding protein